MDGVPITVTAEVIFQTPAIPIRLRYEGEPGTVTAVYDGAGLDVVIGPGVTAKAIQTAMNDAVRGEWFHVEIVNPPVAADESLRPGPPRREESAADRARRWRRESR